MGKGPTRRQGPGKASETVRTIKKASRELDPFKGSRRGGYHDDPSNYRRADDDTSERLNEYLAEVQENGQEDSNCSTASGTRGDEEAGCESESDQKDHDPEL